MSLAGYSDERSAFFMSVLGFADTGGRLVIALVGDRLPCSRILVIPVICLLNAAVTFMLTITTQTAAIFIYVTVVGIGRAILYSITFAVSVETFGHAIHQESFAIILLMNGLGSLMSPLIPGLSFDLTGSYNPANYCFAVLWLVSCAKFLAVFFMKNYRSRKQFASKAERLNNNDVEEVGSPCVEQPPIENTLPDVVRGNEPFAAVPLMNEEVLDGPPRYEEITMALRPEMFVIVDRITAV